MRRLIWLLALCASPALAEVTPPAITALRSVILCSPARKHSEPAPGTEAGFIDVPDEPLTIVREGKAVPLVLGMGFGVAITPARDLGGIRMLSYRPGRAQPDTYVSAFTAGEESTNFFSFDTEEELVPGTWTFEAWEDTDLLYRVTFDAVPADAMPDLVAACRAPTS